MSITARSFLLAVVYLAIVATQYLIARAVGHEALFVSYPSIVPRPEFFEHPALWLLMAILSLGFLFGLLMGNPVAQGGRLPLFDAGRLARYRICMALSGVLYLIIFFAFTGLPDHTAYGVIMIDLVLLIGIIARIGSWATEGRSATMSESS